MTASTDEPHVGLVVEGRGDQGSVPIVFRLHLHNKRGEYRDVLGLPVVCQGRDKALRADGIEKFVAAAAARPGCEGVIVVLDAEGDAACRLGPELLARARATTAKPVAVCLVEDKFEDWLLASAESLDLEGLEYARGANSEARIRAALDTKYVKPTVQPRLASRMDLDIATPRSASLARTLDYLDAFVDAVILRIEADDDDNGQDNPDGAEFDPP